MVGFDGGIRRRQYPVHVLQRTNFLLAVPPGKCSIEVCGYGLRIAFERLFCKGDGLIGVALLAADFGEQRQKITFFGFLL